MANKRITDVDFLESLNSDESFFVNQNNAIKQINKSNLVFDIVNGGTGANNASGARTNLGLGSVATENTVPISKGGTGASNANDALANLGAATANHNHAGQSINPMSVELGSGATNHGGYVDFHFNGTTDDYTSRIIESSSGTIELQKANIVLPNGKGYQQKDTNGDAYSVIFLSTSNTVQIGFGMPDGYKTKINTSMVLTSDAYGDSLPDAGTVGRIFFRKVEV